MGYYTRICYRNGVVKEENKLFELHKTCDCDWCKNKYAGRRRANSITVTVDQENDIKKAVEFLDNWKCSNREKDLPIVYLTRKDL